jgi:hypothetical protein
MAHFSRRAQSAVKLTTAADAVPFVATFHPGAHFSYSAASGTAPLSGSAVSLKRIQ